MKKTTPRMKRMLGLTMLAVVCTAACGGRLLHASAHRLSNGRWTREQICEHALPLMQRLEPSLNKMAVATTDDAVYSADGTPQHLMLVDTTDEAVCSPVHTVWDTDSGKLVEVGHQPLEKTDLQMIVLDARGAESVARQWLEKLGMVHDASAWQVTHPSQICNNCCTVYLQHKLQRAKVVVQRQTHDLCYARVSTMTSRAR